ncbi:MAG TPA: L,D-transpeptidase [Planctomycetes bacterium]|nr:L,D-transpeptidase [Planctomycetota bacterium]
MKTLKTFVPLGVVAFLAASFLFLDGWPFRSPAEEVDKGEGAPGLSRVARPEQNASKVAKDGPAKGAPARKEAKAEPQREEEKALRARLRGLKKDRDAYRKALGAALMKGRLPGDLLAEWRRIVQKDIFTPPPRVAHVKVKVRPGDNLTRIARRVKKAHKGNVTPTLIRLVNGLPNDRIRAGATLAVPTGRLAIEVHKESFRLFVTLDGEPILDRPVGLGKEDSTPVGRFTIHGKTRKPTWTKPDGTVVAYGEPGHIIGSRWMGFANDMGRTGYGIHGTSDPTSIGRSVSEGCIRLRAEDLELLFDLVPEGAPVRVLP